MDRLEALMNFDMIAEEIKVPKGKEIYIDDVEKTIYENGIITVNEERANQIEQATFKGEPLVKRIKDEPKIAKVEVAMTGEEPKLTEENILVETADLKIGNIETADVKTKKSSKKKDE